MKTEPTPATCPRVTSSNPNETPRPTLAIPRPDYLDSEPEVYTGGKTWRRTGVCVRCGAAIYGWLPAGSRDISESTPLHHAVPR